MAQLTIQNAFQLAVQHHQAGRLREAEQLYRQILAQQTEHIDALHLLGVISHQTGRIGAAVDLIRRALALRPNYAEAQNNLGAALKDGGQLDEAVAACRRAIALRPNYAEAYNNLANALKEQGNLDEAIAASRQAIAMKPNFPEAHFNLGNSLKDKGQLDDAVASFNQAITLRPNYAQAHNNLGGALKEAGRVDESISACRRAIALRPSYAEAHDNLGNSLRANRQIDDAIASFRQAIAIKPNYAPAHCNLGNAFADKSQFNAAIASFNQAIAVRPNYAEAHNNLGNALKETDQLDAAITAYEKAITIKPNYAQALSNLGNALKDNGRLDEAIACYRKALELNPPSAFAFENLLVALHYHPDFDARGLLVENQKWSRQHAEPLKQFIQPHRNNRDPNRPLRIGYVSADFYEHASALFLLPLIRCHDRKQFEVTCYAEMARPADRATRLMREHIQHWRETTRMTDAQVAAMIRQDQIDILVDLKLHTANNRLLVFAQKPAPVQATWLGYPGTTGLTTIDYRLTDPWLDPPGRNDADYSEQSIRLPDTFWCYESLSDESPCTTPPAIANGYITFGCLNNFCKINNIVLSLWAKVLNANPTSHLLLLAPEGSARQHVLDRLAADGIAAQRVEMVGRQPRPQYLRTYGRIDIGLDTWPCNGHTTSLDSFWMGVPVITLQGPTCLGRAGLSQLNNLGLPELIARDSDDYVRIAASLSGDLPRLRELHATLRPRMQTSPLMDAPRFARNMEAAYRHMWRKWCETARS